MTESAMLLLERALRPDCDDDELLRDAKTAVREILEEAELRCWELEDEAGWQVPDTDDPVDYAARLLFCCSRLNELVRHMRLVQEITVRKYIERKENP